MDGIDFPVVSRELRHHVDVLDSCVVSLENIQLVVTRTLDTDPYGPLLTELPGMYREAQQRQHELIGYLAHNLRVLSARLRVAAAAYRDEDPDRAEPAVITGSGVTSLAGPRSSKGRSPVRTATDGSSDVDEPTGGSAELELIGPVGTEPPGTELYTPDEFVHTVLDDPETLTGNVSGVADISVSWTEVADSMHRLADRLAGSVSAELGSWTGRAALEYERLAGHNIDAVRGLAGVCAALAEVFGGYVAAMSLVRQELTALVFDAALALAGHRVAEPLIVPQVARHTIRFGLTAATLTRLQRKLNE